jgi:predicted GIY-YIG superfamily endonuclease
VHASRLIALVLAVFALVGTSVASHKDSNSKSSSSRTYSATKHNQETLAKIRERDAREAKEKAERAEKKEAERAKEREKEERKVARDRADDEKRAEQRRREDERRDEKRAEGKRSDDDRSSARAGKDRDRDTGSSASSAKKNDDRSDEKSSAASQGDKRDSSLRQSDKTAAVQYTDVFTVDQLIAINKNPEQRKRLNEFSPNDLSQLKAKGKLDEVQSYVIGSPDRKAAGSTTSSSSRSEDSSNSPTQSSRARERRAEQPSTASIAPSARQTPREVYTSKVDQDRIASMTIQERAALSQQQTVTPGRTAATLPSTTNANSTQAVPGPNTGYTRATVRAMAHEAGKLSYSVAPWLVPELKAVQVLRAASTAERGNVVYVAYKNGKAIYVGITNDLKRRIREHAYDEGVEVQAIDGLTDLTRIEARSVEQALIEKHGMLKDGGQLINQRNSISPLRETYQESKVTGENLLKEARWPGF